MFMWIVECYVSGVGHVAHQIGTSDPATAKEAVRSMYPGRTITGMQVRRA